MKLSDERLREILDGCADAVRGPWRVHHIQIWSDGAEKPPMLLFDVRGWGHLTGNGSGALGMEPAAAESIQDATSNHVARLDPQTVAALVSEVIEARGHVRLLLDAINSGRNEPLMIARDKVYDDLNKETDNGR